MLDAFASFAERAGLVRTARDEIVDRRAVAMCEDRERKALLDDVLGHAVAHQAQADKADCFAGHLAISS